MQGIYILSVVASVFGLLTLFKFEGVRPNNAGEAILWLVVPFTVGANTVLALWLAIKALRVPAVILSNLLLIAKSRVGGVR